MPNNRRDVPLVYIVYGFLASLSIAVGILYLVEDGYWYLVKIPLGLIVWQVYPVSLVIVGCFLVALTYRFKAIALPLLIMAVGAFDTFSAVSLVIVKRDLGQLFFLQLMLMAGGWLIARRPRFRFHWSLLLWIGVLVLASSGLLTSAGEHLYEVLLFFYVYEGTTIVPGGRGALVRGRRS